MSREDDRDSGCVQLAEEVIHTESEFEIDSCSWLIEDEDMRIVDEGACDHESALHASREGSCLGIFFLPESEGSEVLLDVRLRDFWGDTIVACLREDDVIHFLKNPKVELLRNHSDTHASLSTRGIEIVSTDDDSPTRLIHEARDDTDRRRLPCTVRSEQREEVTFFDIKSDSLQCFCTTGVDFFQIMYRDGELFFHSVVFSELDPFALVEHLL